MPNIVDLIRSLRNISLIMFQLGDFEKQKTIEAAADLLEAFEKERLKCST